MVELLVLAGADVNDVNKAGCTPFRLAAREGLSKIASLLVKNGADMGDGLLSPGP